MKKMLIYRAIPMFLIFICGCVSLTGYPERSGNVEDELKQLDKYHDPALIAKYEQEQDPNKTNLRNEIVNARIRAIDIHFNTFQQSLYSEGVSSALATDWTVISLSAAGAIVSSLDTSQALSAISGGITGAKASFDKNAFFDKTMPAILSQMTALRKSILVKIRSDLTREVSEYPLNEALIDVEDYFIAGTIPGAITGIIEVAGYTSREADEKLNVVVLDKRATNFVVKEKQNRIDEFLTVIDKLSDGRAFELNKNPPVQNASLDKVILSRDQGGKRFTDGKAARDLLKMRVALDNRDDKTLDAWEEALKAE